MRKIKILHIIKSLGRGGAEMLLPETLKIHDTNKFEFHYIYFLPWKDQMVSALEDAGGEVTCMDAKNNIYLFLRYNKVIDYCKREKIDLIHCHLPWAGFLGRLVFKKTGIPVLYTEHNMQERYHVITKKINKSTFNHQSMAFGVSEDVTNSIKNNIHPSIPVKTLLNGVNTDFFTRKGDTSIRKELEIPTEAIVLGNVAVFRFQKRLKEWLQVFAKVQASNPNVYGIIVGAGPLENEIKEVFNNLNLEGKVFFPGLQTEVKPFFEAMDIFMMSSSFEGLPIALLEAMSMECAVIATDAGGIKEVVINGETGLTCKVEAWEKLNELVQVLLDDPAKLKKYKIAARKRVIEAFSLKTMVGELESHYNSVLES
ncbi:glycosyltransferase [Autumnicola psychrophila]|uniref:Glycosyltransferase n=1 Tax=Autumnicola psychrophila TaxID=3075592 RepID=A0ABU3DS71_9FLAO|nr:glycosyltransferase [Zunongwangia sp. F225]MDT0686559.1 glycosyltransferase [Zunongwangia sp. F225]